MTDTRTERVVVDAAAMGGKPAVRGTRIPMGLDLNRLAKDLDLRALIVAYPRLTPQDARVASLMPTLDILRIGCRGYPR